MREISFSRFGYQPCARCGKMFPVDLMGPLMIPLHPELCSSCKKKYAKDKVAKIKKMIEKLT